MAASDADARWQRELQQARALIGAEARAEVTTFDRLLEWVELGEGQACGGGSVAETDRYLREAGIDADMHAVLLFRHAVSAMCTPDDVGSDCDDDEFDDDDDVTE